MDVLNPNLGEVRWVASQSVPVAKIIIRAPGW